jgi:hypothetical protein
MIVMLLGSGSRSGLNSSAVSATDCPKGAGFDSRVLLVFFLM